MNSVTKTFVEFTYPIEESKSVEIKGGTKLRIPKDVFCFRFYDIIEKVEEGILFKSERTNESPRYYPDGEILTLEAIKYRFPDFDSTIQAIKDAGEKSGEFKVKIT